MNGESRCTGGRRFRQGACWRVRFKIADCAIVTATAIGLTAVSLVLAAPASAQDMTSSDISRLEQSVDQISSDLVQLRQRDRAGARALQAELNELDEDLSFEDLSTTQQAKAKQTTIEAIVGSHCP